MPNDFFSLAGSDSNTNTSTLSIEEYIAAESDKTQLSNELNEYIDIMSLVFKAELTIESLEESLVLDKSRTEENKLASYHEYIIACESLGYVNKLDPNTASLEDIKLAKEAITEEGKGLIKKYTTAVMENFSAWGGFFRMFNSYNSKKLQKYKEDIIAGILVPRKQMNEKDLNKLKDRYAIMNTLGYSLSNNIDGLIEYLKTPLDRINKEHYYTNLITNVHKTLVAGSEFKQSNVTKTLVTNLAKTQKMAESVNRIRLMVPISMFGTRLSLLSIVENENKSEAKDKKFKTYSLHTDIIKLDPSKTPDIKPLDKNQVIKLLDFGIDSQDDINKAIKASKGMFGKTIITNAIATMGSVVIPVPGLGIVYQALIGRFVTNISNHSLIVMKNMLKYDDLITEYINATYEKAEEKNRL